MTSISSLGASAPIPQNSFLSTGNKVGGDKAGAANSFRPPAAPPATVTNADGSTTAISPDQTGKTTSSTPATLAPTAQLTSISGDRGAGSKSLLNLIA